ncbi:hypothetical protein [Archangium violaceum]|uniref:hypothetical protein n=1 Tax=Archangium violaceum TaxID=83451 RepID=UPI0036DE0562
MGTQIAIAQSTEDERSFGPYLASLVGAGEAELFYAGGSRISLVDNWRRPPLGAGMRSGRPCC